MKPYYQKHEIEMIEQEYRLFRTDKSKTTEIDKLLYQIVKTNDPQSPMYRLAHNGLLMRLKIMDRCIEDIFRVTPVDLGRPTTENELLDLLIYIKCALFNLYGILENLMGIYAVATNFKGMKPGQSFFAGNKATSDALLKTLPRHIQKEFHSSNEWIKYIKAARNFLAHQEPFYVAPQAIIKGELKKWNELERERSRINRAYWEKIRMKSDDSDELKSERRKLEAEKNSKLLEIDGKQMEYLFSHPVIDVDLSKGHDPLIKVHLPALRDRKIVLEKILLVLNHIERNSKP